MATHFNKHSENRKHRENVRKLARVCCGGAGFGPLFPRSPPYTNPRRPPVAAARMNIERAVVVTPPDDSLSSRKIATFTRGLKSSLPVSPRAVVATRVVLGIYTSQPPIQSAQLIHRVGSWIPQWASRRHYTDTTLIYALRHPQCLQAVEPPLEERDEYTTSYTPQPSNPFPQFPSSSRP